MQWYFYLLICKHISVDVLVISVKKSHCLAETARFLYMNETFNGFFVFVIVELKDLRLQEKKLREKFKQEDGIVSAVSLWTNEILPNWETM